MKTKTILKSLDALSHQALEPEPDRPVQGHPEPSPADGNTQRENQRHISVPDHAGIGYRHWGLNE